MVYKTLKARKMTQKKLYILSKSSAYSYINVTPNHCVLFHQTILLIIVKSVENSSRCGTYLLALASTPLRWMVSTRIRNNHYILVKTTKFVQRINKGRK